MADNFNTLDRNYIIDLAGGQIAFPATQNPSSDPNTLDDYEEGTFTPALEAVTIGDLAVTYSTQEGFYTRVGNCVNIQIEIVTTLFTYTSASGLLRITGVPFAIASPSAVGPLAYRGWTAPAGYVDLVSNFSAATVISFMRSSNAGAGKISTDISEWASGSNPNFRLSMTYFA